MKKILIPLVILLIVSLCIIFPLIMSNKPPESRERVLADAILLYAEPSTTSQVLTTLSKGSIVALQEEVGTDWVRTETSDGVSGYIRTELLAGLSAPSATASASATPSPVPSDPPTVGTPKTTPESSPESAPQSEAVRRVPNTDAAKTTVQATRPTPLPTVTPLVNLFAIDHEKLTIDQKIALLKTRFPQGKYWNHLGIEVGSLAQDISCTAVTDIPCIHMVNGYEYCNEYDSGTMDLFDYGDNIQCLGFASMISDFLFGKNAPFTEFYDFADLRVGDHIRLLEYEHSMIVTEIDDGTLHIAECNYDYENCQIDWERVVTEDDLSEYACEFITRYQ